jgi:hypothetical protein
LHPFYADESTVKICRVPAATVKFQAWNLMKYCFHCADYGRLASISVTLLAHRTRVLRLPPCDRARADVEPLTPRAGEDSQVRAPFENRAAQTRIATTMEHTIAAGVIAKHRRPRDKLRPIQQHHRSLCAGLSAPEVDDELELGPLHDRQISRLGAFEDLAGVDAPLPKGSRSNFARGPSLSSPPPAATAGRVRVLHLLKKQEAQRSQPPCAPFPFPRYPPRGRTY